VIGRAGLRDSRARSCDPESLRLPWHQRGRVHLGPGAKRASAARREPACLEGWVCRSRVASIFPGSLYSEAIGQPDAPTSPAMDFADLRARLRAARTIASAFSGDRRRGQRGVGPDDPGPFAQADPQRGTGGEVLLCLLAKQQAQLPRPEAVTRTVCPLAKQAQLCGRESWRPEFFSSCSGSSFSTAPCRCSRAPVSNHRTYSSGQPRRHKAC